MKTKTTNILFTMALVASSSVYAQSDCREVYPYNIDEALGTDLLIRDHNRTSITDFRHISGITLGTLINFADINGDGIDDALKHCRNGSWMSYGVIGNDGRTTYPDFFKATDNYGSPQWGKREMRRLADINGDGLADIVGFGYSVVFSSLSLGDGRFGPETLSIPDFTRKYGWEITAGKRRVVDINGDGAADIVGFYGNNLDISLSLADGRFERVRRVLTNFYIPGYRWTNSKGERTLYDINGDGLLDAVGRKNRDPAVRIVAYNKGDGTFGQPVAISDPNSKPGSGGAKELPPIDNGGGYQEP